jgi:hypothetical protein
MKNILFNARINEELVKRFKILSIKLSKRQNRLLEEAMQDLLKKYQKGPKKGK